MRAEAPASIALSENGGDEDGSCGQEQKECWRAERLERVSEHHAEKQRDEESRHEIFHHENSPMKGRNRVLGGALLHERAEPYKERADLLRPNEGAKRKGQDACQASCEAEFRVAAQAFEEEAQALHNPRMHEHEEDAASEHKGNMLRLEEHQ